MHRPAIDEDPKAMRDLAFTIVRVLNRAGDAVGPWAGSLTDDELLESLLHMMLLRSYDARMLTAQRQCLGILQPQLSQPEQNAPVFWRCNSAPGTVQRATC